MRSEDHAFAANLLRAGADAGVLARVHRGRAVVAVRHLDLADARGGIAVRVGDRVGDGVDAAVAAAVAARLQREGGAAGDRRRKREEEAIVDYFYSEKLF